MSRTNERVAKLKRNLAELRSRGQRIWAEADLLVRDVRSLETELAAVLREQEVPPSAGGQP